MVLEECYMCLEYCDLFFEFSFISRSVFQECLSLPAWLNEGSELGSCGVAIFKTCSAGLWLKETF